MNLPFASVKDVIDELHECRFRHLNRLFYNWADAVNTNQAWLTATSEKRGVKYAKFKVFQDASYTGDDHFFCGINLEKGLVVPAGVAAANDIMDKTWFWHRFVDFSNGPFADRVEKACKESKHDLKLFVSVGTLGDSKDNAYVVFDVLGRDLKQEESGGSVSVLGGLPGAKSIAEFSDELKMLNSGGTLNFYWMDVVAGQLFTSDTSGPDDLDRCADMLAPFEDWLPQFSK